jgi:hypothetical protein
VTSVTAAGTNTNAINVTVTEAGKFEIEVSGVLTCTTFSTSGNVIIAFTQSGGTGSFTFTNPSTASYAVTALSQTIRFRHTAVYTTTGSGSWQIRAGWTDDGSGNAYSAANLGLRVTVVRRF